MPHKNSSFIPSTPTKIPLQRVNEIEGFQKFNIPWFGARANNIAKLDGDDLSPVLGLSESEQPWSRLAGNFWSKN